MHVRDINNNENLKNAFSLNKISYFGFTILSVTYAVYLFITAIFESIKKRSLFLGVTYGRYIKSKNYEWVFIYAVIFQDSLLLIIMYF